LSREDAAPGQPPVLLEARDLGFAYAGVPVLHGLSFELRAGLNLVRGGDGRGKTTLLALLAGRLRPSAGVLACRAATISFEQPCDAACDAVVAQAWLRARQAALPAWDEALAAGLAEAFALGPHLGKPMSMLSAGTRRKVGLVAAVAGGAALTLLDTPFAALDAPSSRVLGEVLREAVADRHRAWVVADHGCPACLHGLALAATLDLGD